MARKINIETPATDKLEAIGIEAICERIENGETYREIAASIPGVSAATLCNWLNKEAHAEQSARARTVSAEAWLDRGLDAISSSMNKDGRIDPTAARAYAQECARRAAIRNPKYRDKPETSVNVNTNVSVEQPKPLTDFYAEQSKADTESGA